MKIVEYSTSSFNATALAFGPDGRIHVTGSDSNNGHGEVLRYADDGTGESTFIDLGASFDLSKGSAIAFSAVPKPSSCPFFSGLGLAALAFGWPRLQ